MEVGIRELKAKLSEYVALAASGESITVTDRGTPVARLVPAADSLVAIGIDEGWIEAPRRTGLSPATRHRAAMSILDALDDDRGMTLYVDTSALLKRYVDERDSRAAEALLATDPVLVTSRITEIEARRNLVRLLDSDDADRARRALTADLDAFALVAVDATTCAEAARIAESTLCRSLDAIHLASALRAGRATTLLTFDHRQARVAREVGLTTIGA